MTFPGNPPFHPTPRQLSGIKRCVFLLSLLPFLRLVIFTLTDRLGANPLEFISRNSGDWTLYFLCITLAVTPLRKWLQWPWLIKLRRMLGLFVFFYACLHFMTFVWFDHFFDLSEMFRDVIKRPFITVGFITFVLLIPLAATSSNRMVRLLGGKRWQWLHRLIYLIAPLAIVHFWWMKAGKHDFAQPILMGLIVASLLLVRLVSRVRQRRQQKRFIKISPI
ncbi:MAG: protein-methionine-sulfoxide reductase heme-binding subunit MsrQ [Oxalobacteraceae bacterium]|nr:protein-methionine-sulfoxide reductase heme-binding subunit MsrQ [Oxalobacteraceae bacterium]